MEKPKLPIPTSGCAKTDLILTAVLAPARSRFFYYLTVHNLSTMDPKLTRQIRILQIYAGFLTIVVAALAALFFLQGDRKQHFKEIDAERINIVESNGALRMVISNQKEQHPGAIDGKMIPHRDRPAGMMFFNDNGDECGGLTFDGNKKEASMVYSIDQYKNDQVMQLQYNQDNGTSRQIRSYGLKIWDRSDALTLGDLLRVTDSLNSLHDTAIYNAAIQKMQSEGLLGVERLFLGKTKAREVGLFIRDDKGRPRIKIGLDSLNNILFQALDTNGKIIPLSAEVNLLLKRQ